MSQGEIFATACGLSWAMGVVFFTRVSRHFSPLAINLYKNSFALLGLLLTMFFLADELFPNRPAMDYWILIFSGVLGLGLADLLFLMSLRTLGASSWAIVECSYSPLVILCGYLLLAERLAWLDYVGGFFILMAITLISLERGANGGSVIPHWRAIGLGVLSMLFTAIGVVVAKPVYQDASVLWANVIRLVGGVGVLIPLGHLVLPGQRVWSCFKPSKHFWLTTAGAFFGSYLALIFWLAGMKYTLVGKAAILNQLSTVFIVLLALIFLKERLNRSKTVAIILAFIGAALICL